MPDEIDDALADYATRRDAASLKPWMGDLNLVLGMLAPSEAQMAQLLDVFRFLLVARGMAVQTGNRNVNRADITAAFDDVAAFAGGSGPLRFARANRRQIAAQLLIRLYNVAYIHQMGVLLCGAYAFLYELGAQDPQAYVRFVIDVLTQPRARLRGKGTRGPAGAPWIDVASAFAGRFQPTLGDFAADEIPAACLRNFAMSVEYVAGDVNTGYTTPAQLTQWLSLAGFTEVIDRTVTEADDPSPGVLANSRLPGARAPAATQHRLAGYQGPQAYVSRFWGVGPQDLQAPEHYKKKLNNLHHAQLKLRQGHRVFVLCHGGLVDVLERRPPGPVGAHSTHWVSLVSANVSHDACLGMTVFTWGRVAGEANRAYDLGGLLTYYKGFVSGRP